MVARNDGDPGEFTLFTIIGQGFFFLVAIGLANLCYQLGPLSELLVRPSNVDAFRHWVFGTGLTVSMALPFAMPTLVFYLALSVASDNGMA